MFPLFECLPPIPFLLNGIYPVALSLTGMKGCLPCSPFHTHSLCSRTIPCSSGRADTAPCPSCAQGCWELQEKPEQCCCVWPPAMTLQKLQSLEQLKYRWAQRLSLPAGGISGESGDTAVMHLPDCLPPCCLPGTSQQLCRAGCWHCCCAGCETCCSRAGGQAQQAAHTLPKEACRQMECPNKAIQPKRPCRWSSLTMHWAMKLSSLSLIRWDDFAAALSSGAQSSRIAELILWNVKKQLHKIAVWSIWLLEHVENSKKHFFFPQAGLQSIFFSCYVFSIEAAFSIFYYQILVQAFTRQLKWDKGNVNNLHLCRGEMKLEQVKQLP